MDRLSKEEESINRPSLLGVYKAHTTNIYSTSKVPTTSTIVYTLYILYLLTRVLVGSKPIIVEAKLLTKTLYLL